MVRIMAKVGRPTKYKPEMCKIVVDMMREGAALCEVCAEIGIIPDTMDRWRKEARKKEFSDAVKKGIALSESWWTKKGRVNLENNKFSYTGWYMNMKNRFGWRDQKQIEVNANITGKVGVIALPMEREVVEIAGEEQTTNSLVASAEAKPGT